MIKQFFLFLFDLFGFLFEMLLIAFVFGLCAIGWLVLIQYVALHGTG